MPKSRIIILISLVGLKSRPTRSAVEVTAYPASLHSPSIIHTFPSHLFPMHLVCCECFHVPLFSFLRPKLSLLVGALRHPLLRAILVVDSLRTSLQFHKQSIGLVSASFFASVPVSSELSSNCV
ncbi:hypothetical protein T439DRAFT_174510 [Meredithblackwellia eburnea MCA 4105]